MAGIFKDENVYVFINEDGVSNASVENGIYICGSKRQSNHLYGGRVKVSMPCRYGCNQTGEVSILVDGVLIREIQNDARFRSDYPLDKIVAFLNQIENLGVDSFLENYKQQLQQAKLEFEAFADGLQQELTINYDEKKAEELSKYRKFILSLGCILFALLINMNAGLQNQDYINAYENIINTYF